MSRKKKDYSITVNDEWFGRTVIQAGPKWGPAMYNTVKTMVKNGACSSVRVARRYATPVAAWRTIRLGRAMQALEFLGGSRHEDALWKAGIYRVPSPKAKKILLQLIPNPSKLPTLRKFKRDLAALVRSKELPGSPYDPIQQPSTIS